MTPTLRGAGHITVDFFQCPDGQTTMLWAQMKWGRRDSLPSPPLHRKQRSTASMMESKQVLFAGSILTNRFQMLTICHIHPPIIQGLGCIGTRRDGNASVGDGHHCHRHRVQGGRQSAGETPVCRSEAGSIRPACSPSPWTMGSRNESLRKRVSVSSGEPGECGAPMVLASAGSSYRSGSAPLGVTGRALPTPPNHGAKK